VAGGYDIRGREKQGRYRISGVSNGSKPEDNKSGKNQEMWAEDQAGRRNNGQNGGTW